MPSKKQKEIDYVGEIATGHPNKAAKTIRQKVAQLAQNSSKIYVGKTNGVAGLKRRFRRKYRRRGYDRIVPVYETKSDQHAHIVEDLVIEHITEKYPNVIENKIDGGGGDVGNCNRKIVYVATKKKLKKI